MGLNHKISNMEKTKPRYATLPQNREQYVLGPSSLVNFIDWLGSRCGQVMFFVSLTLPLG